MCLIFYVLRVQSLLGRSRVRFDEGNGLRSWNASGMNWENLSKNHKLSLKCVLLMFHEWSTTFLLPAQTDRPANKTTSPVKLKVWTNLSLIQTKNCLLRQQDTLININRSLFCSTQLLGVVLSEMDHITTTDHCKSTENVCWIWSASHGPYLTCTSSIFSPLWE